MPVLVEKGSAALLTRTVGRGTLAPMRSVFVPAMLAACATCAGALAQQAPAPAGAASSPPLNLRVGPEYTPGWEMMTPEERDAYRQKMFAVPTKQECRRLRDEQIKAAAQRARVRGIKDIPDPRYDACE